MIPRYSRPQMAAIWSDRSRYEIWLEIETLAAEAMEQLGQIPAGTSKALRERGAFDIARIDEIEREVKHDVIAFLTSVTEHVGPEARFMHQGMTSSDVLDTCLAVQLTRAADILLADLDALLEALKRRAIEHKYTVTVGRSHGIHAEPTTFGLKLAFAYAEFSRAKERLLRAKEDVGTCAISGAVGTFAHLDPRVEVYVAGKLGLKPEPVSTQIIPRDRHAMFFATLGVIASSVERLATEIRHLQRTEVGEAEEFFSAGQKGSSAMPHKRNPVLTENLTGLARLVRGYAPARHGKCGALARARYLSFLGRTLDRAGRNRDPRLCAGPARGRDRQARGLSRADAREPGARRRPCAFAAGATSANAKGSQPRGCLPPRPAQRDARV